MGKPLVLQFPVSASKCPVRWSCSRAGAVELHRHKATSLLLLVAQPHFHNLPGSPHQGKRFVLAEEIVVEHTQTKCSRRNKRFLQLQCPGSREGEEGDVPLCQALSWGGLELSLSSCRHFPAPRTVIWERLCLAFDLPHDQL